MRTSRALDIDDEKGVERAVAHLLAQEAISSSALERAKIASRHSGDRIDQTLLKLGLVDERMLIGAWSGAIGIPVLQSADIPTRPLLTDALPSRFLLNVGAFPVSLKDSHVTLAVVDPLNRYALASVAARVGRTTTPALVDRSTFENAFRQLYPELRQDDDDIPSDAGGDAASGDIIQLRDLATDAPAIRCVNAMIEHAVECGASDIHITATRFGSRLRYRIDGRLHEAEAHPPHLHASIVSRLKVLADLDVAEQRLPQDGRIRKSVRGREVDLRIATMPHLDGEGAVIRLLDSTVGLTELEALGLADNIYGDLIRLLRQPHGILLVTGPTGSGKTTTLYALLRRLVRPELNVVSVEDPVEYCVSGVTQIQTNKKIGLDFPSVLRSILRQDPDVIMIGEIRDAETASIANQAALTGHFVLATLHTNSAAASLPRLLDMGIEPYLLASTIRGALAQRLVRSLCPHCSRPVEADSAQAVHLRGLAFKYGMTPQTWQPRESVGCSRCRGSGYLGRTAIAELLIVNDAIRSAMLDRSDASRFESIAANNGLITLIHAGLGKVLKGETTLSEVFCAVGELG